MHVVPRLPKFLAAHPDLSIDIILDDRTINLLEEGVDISLRMGTLNDSSLIARKLATGRRLVLGARSYFDRAGVPATPAELAAHQGVIYSPGGGGESWSFHQNTTEVSVGVSGRLRISAAEGVRAAVIGGMGLTIASEWMFAPELQSGEVRAVLTDWTLPSIDLWAVFPAGRMASAKGRAFASFVEAELRHTHSARE